MRWKEIWNLGNPVRGMVLLANSESSSVLMDLYCTQQRGTGGDNLSRVRVSQIEKSKEGRWSSRLTFSEYWQRMHGLEGLQR
jgi:hypothetical protein